ncbi:MAG: hypothetical protein LBJ98_03780 [Endomicrobium sp.]|jgi:hypothetical protein|nr:hypothetical protein [Endomicrobium sp.]
MYYKWFCVDGISLPVSGTVMSKNQGEDLLEISNNYFEEFDYEPSENFSLISPVHNRDTFSLYEEEACFKIKHNDVCDNPPGTGYPCLALTFHDGSTQTYVMTKSDFEDDVYFYKLHLNKGSYKYKYITTNKYHAKGFYETEGNWHVTSKPYNFIKKRPFHTSEVLPDNVCFAWIVTKGEENDILSYEIYIGRNASKEKLPKFEINPEKNSSMFIIPRLEHKKQYYWYMRITNQFGASLETEMFSFVTGGMVEKLYNAPNPFNPARGIETEFVFPMFADGTCKMTIYSEYGDLVWESDSLSLSGNNSQVIRYNGKDNSGRLLYTGTYLAVLEKKYADKTEIEKCRILVIK